MSESSGIRHTITIIIQDDGEIYGKFDGRCFYPIGTESTAESTTIDGQAKSVLKQMLDAMVVKDFSGK